jgi:hypothetical protein
VTLRVAAISIGQTPRPDLLEPILRHLPPDRASIIEIGALDGLAVADLPTPTDDGYPLGTRLRDGTRVIVDEAFLEPLVQSAIDSAEDGGASASILLCAGGFASLTATRPLVRPFELAATTLRSMGIERIVVIVPTADQIEPVRRKWTAAGFEPVLLDARLAEVPASLQASSSPDGPVVLDYVGHQPAAVERLRSVVDRPLVDLGGLAAAALASIVPSGTHR